MGIFDKLFGSSKNNLGSNKQLNAIYSDTSYLDKKEQPQALIITNINNVLWKWNTDTSKRELHESNVTILKDLATHFNVKVIACTFYKAPNDKRTLKEALDVFHAAGISEAYYALGEPAQMLSVHAKELVSNPVGDMMTGLEKAQAFKYIAKQYGILPANCAVIESGNPFTLNELEQEGYTAVASPKQLDDFRKKLTNG